MMYWEYKDLRKNCEYIGIKGNIWIIERSIYDFRKYREYKEYNEYYTNLRKNIGGIRSKEV